MDGGPPKDKWREPMNTILFGKGLCGCNYISWKLGQVLNTETGILIAKEKTQRHRRECHVKMEAEIEDM